MGWVKPLPELTWFLNGKEFRGELSDVKVTEQPNVVNSPGLKVEQTAHLVIEDLPDEFDFTCRASVFNSSKTGEEIFHKEAQMKLSSAGLKKKTILAFKK